MKKIVLAPDRRAFVDWMRKNNVRMDEIVFGDNVRLMHGVFVSEIVVLPGFWLRKDACQLHNAAMSRVVR